ncbi:MAG: lysine--tRNA ligase [Chloroflexi bacterium]|nr:lysine--tRNA ligase [Chloroflexota bacterium]MCI0796698.1 lysine--tRNA ligase [Chloroflexota bacterium]MCI0822009.1 lysine--tRNA ligase [Chloroflexota bacterium]MCI0868663.1 lysine--tRNA ligase [Chloroflexota bacterium]MCI0886787.1 lysine--tRNA ligase [Chloroflexota bacterium]
MTQPENELIRVRLEKLERLREKGIQPYPNKYHRSHTSQQAKSLFEAAEAENSEDARTEEVTVGGRLVAFRGMGRASFGDLLDGEGRVQVLFRRNTLTDTYELLQELDVGDWLGVRGPVFRTRTGEITVEAKEFTILCKAIRPLPEKWHGLTDVETRFRQRYLDLIANPEARRAAVMRSNIVAGIRAFMTSRGFLEVETPILVSVAAGGMAHPFVTHHNQLGRDLYLRIATELHLKRLIIGGMEKVYEIGKIFRNEGVDQTHNPEFTTMESYEAFADYNDVMCMVEDMAHTVARQVLGSSVSEFDGHRLDFTPPWPRLSLLDEIKKYSGIDVPAHSDIESMKSAMADIGIEVSQQMSWPGLMDKLISSKVEPNLIQPCFLMDYPVEMSPLAKTKSDNPRLVERFEGFAAGMEICNAFTELNDPIDQRERFQQQEELRSQFAGEETDRLDEDFLVAIEHGMPPTGGLGIGIDRLAMLFSGHKTIREVVLFPQMR